MRNRAGVIIVQFNHVVLIRRKKPGQEVYYAVPGGGIEPGESPKQAAIREAWEELGVKVKTAQLAGTLQGIAGEEFYYHAAIISGSLGDGTGQEYQQDPNRGSYEPMWIPLLETTKLTILPKAILPLLSLV